MRSPWVTRAIRAMLPSKSHDPVIPVGHKESWPVLEPDPYLASLEDDAYWDCGDDRGFAHCERPSGHEGWHEGRTPGDLTYAWPPKSQEDHNA